ncbi:MAG: hypothetical protein ACR2OB_02480 [Solirubrobacteraceae bacterium]
MTDRYLRSGRDDGAHGSSEDEGLVMFLEPDQLVADTSHPVARAHLGPRASAALWALRVFVLVVSFMVIYTFVRQLG